MTEESNEVKRQRGPNKIDVLEKEINQLREIIIRMSHYTGTGKVLIDLGVDPKDLYVPTRGEMKRQ